MRRTAALRGAAVLALGALACAAPVEVDSIPPCTPLREQPPLAAASCEAQELADYTAVLSEAVGHEHRSLVRVAFDETARVAAVCVERGDHLRDGRARRDLAARLEAMRALAPGPQCLAGRRIDLNRYEAALAEMDEARERCTRHADPVQPQWQVHGWAVGVPRERCLERATRWIVLEVPNAPRPWIFVKPEVPDPPGPRAREPLGRCRRVGGGPEAVAACVERDGWERLTPPTF